MLITLLIACLAPAQPLFVPADAGIGPYLMASGKAGGVAALYTQLGHEVRFISVTNGEAGHQQLSGRELAERRRREAANAGKVLGIRYDVLDHRDGRLQPTIEARFAMIALIREYRPDLILTHRPNDYHPDHRYTSQLVCDAAYMVTVPFFCPDTPHLTTNPVFFFYPDRFQTPNPFKPDVVVAIDSVIDKKLDALDLLVSQFYEGGANGDASMIPSDPTADLRRPRSPGVFRREERRLR